jgi:hypothetical protein
MYLIKFEVVMEEDNEIAKLDIKMKELGMIPLSVMLETNPLGKYAVNKDVNNMDKFEKWIDMRFKEMMKMKVRMILDKEEDDELYEWVLSHAAVLGEIRTQFNECKGN